MAKKRRSTSRRRVARRRSPSRRAFAFLPAGTLPTVAATAAGLVGSNMLIDRLPLPAQLQVGNGRILAKVGIGIVGAMVLRRFAGGKVAAGVLTGAMTGAALDLYNRFAGRGVSGMGEGFVLPADTRAEQLLGQGFVTAQDTASEQLSGDVVEYESA